MVELNKTIKCIGCHYYSILLSYIKSTNLKPRSLRDDLSDEPQSPTSRTTHSSRTTPCYIWHFDHTHAFEHWLLPWIRIDATGDLRLIYGEYSFEWVHVLDRVSSSHRLATCVTWGKRDHMRSIRTYCGSSATMFTNKPKLGIPIEIESLARRLTALNLDYALCGIISVFFPYEYTFNTSGEWTQ